MESTPIPLKIRTPFQRLIRIPNMWYKQYNSLKGVPFLIKVSFLWNSAKIVMKKRK